MLPGYAPGIDVDPSEELHMAVCDDGIPRTINPKYGCPDVELSLLERDRNSADSQFFVDRMYAKMDEEGRKLDPDYDKKRAEIRAKGIEE